VVERWEIGRDENRGKKGGRVNGEWGSGGGKGRDDNIWGKGEGGMATYKYKSNDTWTREREWENETR